MRNVIIGGIGAALVALIIYYLMQPSDECPSRFTGSIGNTQRLEAMLSVHAHAHWPHRDFPSGVKPVGLDSAVSILNADEDRLAPSRKRRAIAKLTAYAFGKRIAIRAIECLGGDWAAIKAEFDDRIVLASDSIVAPAFADVSTDTAELESDIADFVADSFPIVSGDCTGEAGWKELYTSVFSEGQTSGFQVSVEVGRDLGTVARTIDPQAWDQCSKFFTPPKPPQGTFLAGKAEDGSPIPTPSLPYGETYPDQQILYENYECAVNGCTAWFKNYLGINAALNSGPGTYTALYWLDAHHTGIDEVEVDHGSISARAVAAEQTHIVATKRIRFGSPAVNGATLAALQHAELAGELAEIVCCEIP